MIKNILSLTFVLVLNGAISNSFAQGTADWNVDFGVRWFKHSADGIPNEIQYNAVFDRWERINQDFENYSVSDYQALEPLYFVMNFGTDLFIRYKEFLLIKIGYDYSNSFGNGGTGHITYTDNLSGTTFTEFKEFNYSSHQINYFIGPIVRIGDRGSEMYLAICPMPPTWVTYNEKYSKSEDGTTVAKYNKTFKGFFGSCRALAGIQVPITEKLKFGGEVVFTFLNYMKLESDEIQDYSFQFPKMKWNFTFRYEIL